MCGKKVRGIERSTFLLNEKGILKKSGEKLALRNMQMKYQKQLSY